MLNRIRTCINILRYGSKKSLFHTKSRDIQCDYINKLNKTQSGYCEKTKDGFLILYYNKNIKSKWEVDVYLKFLQNNLVPLIIHHNSFSVIYDTRGSTTLAEYLKSNNVGVQKCCIQEAFRFVSQMYEYGVVHGNLHCFNLILSSIGIFRVVDLMNAYTHRQDFIWDTPSYQRSSFLGEYELKCEYMDGYNIMRYWDCFTLYVSIKQLYKTDRHCEVVGNYLESTVRMYIPDKVLNKLLSKFVSYKHISLFPKEWKALG